MSRVGRGLHMPIGLLVTCLTVYVALTVVSPTHRPTKRVKVDSSPRYSERHERLIHYYSHCWVKLLWNTNNSKCTVYNVYVHCICTCLFLKHRVLSFTFFFVSLYLHSVLSHPLSLSGVNLLTWLMIIKMGML